MHLTQAASPGGISIHALLAESDGIQAETAVFVPPISIHALLAESDVGASQGADIEHISIHALLAESDLMMLSMVAIPIIFLSTLSLRRATPALYQLYDTYAFLSTLSLRRATAPNRRPYHCNRNFYPRSPCGERHSLPLNYVTNRRHFYPRSPCGERLSRYVFSSACQNFYPRSPCGERPAELTTLVNKLFISIHALLAESDVVGASQGADLGHISIHALLAESDPLRQLQFALCGNFYPRSPCGERRLLTLTGSTGGLFLSTLSLRRATAQGADSWN